MQGQSHKDKCVKGWGQKTKTVPGVVTFIFLQSVHLPASVSWHICAITSCLGETAPSREENCRPDEGMKRWWALLFHLVADKCMIFILQFNQIAVLVKSR